MSDPNTARTTQLEAHYCTSPFVKECCVLTLHHPEQPGRARLYAVVVPDMELLRARRIVNAGDLLRFELEGLAHGLPPEDRVVDYEIWFEPLPRTTTRAIERDEIERRVRARQHLADPPLSDADHAWLADPCVAAALPAIEARSKTRRRIRPDSNLELDLGLDSMERIELVAELEQQFGVTISDTVAADVYTARQLMAAVRSALPAGAGDRFRTVTAVRAAGELWAEILRPRSGYEWLLRRRTFAAPILFGLLRLAHRLFFRVRVAGLENMPRSGPFILAPNHQSYLDPFLICGALPFRVFKAMFFVGAPEYFETPLTRWAARMANLVAVDPDSNLVPAMQAAAFGLMNGKILLLFPEGERSIDGSVKKFKKGAPTLAQLVDVPIVPVALDGAYALWPRNRAFNWRLLAPWSGHRIRIAIGDPMRVPAGVGYHDAAAALRDRVNAMWRALSS